MSTKGNTLLFVPLIIVGIIVAIAFYFLGLKPQGQTTTPNNQLQITPPITPTVTPTPTFSSSPTEVQEPKTGIIEGSLSYPSEGIPKDLMVCAENTQTKVSTCTNKQIKDKKYTYGVGYQLEVPQGSYLVYAKLPNDNYRAYYNEFVTCGLSVNCPSHEPIEVKVNAGTTTKGIDPQDWYNQ